MKDEPELGVFAGRTYMLNLVYTVETFVDYEGSENLIATTSLEAAEKVFEESKSNGRFDDIYLITWQNGEVLNEKHSYSTKVK